MKIVRPRRIRPWRKNSRKGFTLIELLIVMAIIGILTATIIVNFGKNENQDMRLEEDRFITFLRNVQNKALAGEKDPDNPNRHICGWGAHRASETELWVFYSYETELQYQNSLPCSDSVIPKTYDAASTPVVETYKIARGVTVKIIDGSQGDVFFLVPGGRGYYNGDSDQDNWPFHDDPPNGGDIYLLEKGSGSSYSSNTVSIRWNGVIE